MRPRTSRDSAPAYPSSVATGTLGVEESLLGDACLKTMKGGAPSSLVREKKKEKGEEEEREMGHGGGKRGGERVF